MLTFPTDQHLILTYVMTLRGCITSYFKQTKTTVIQPLMKVYLRNFLTVTLLSKYFILTK